jgi:predicted secreted hydrolase
MRFVGRSSLGGGVLVLAIVLAVGFANAASQPFGVRAGAGEHVRTAGADLRVARQLSLVWAGGAGQGGGGEYSFCAEPWVRAGGEPAEAAMDGGRFGGAGAQKWVSSDLAGCEIAGVPDTPPPRIPRPGTDPPNPRKTTPGGFTIATAPYEFVWPRDHAAHPDYETEWWYYTGHLATKEGRRFGYELTFFRIGLKPGDPRPGAGESRWRGHELFPAHFAITDVQGQRFFHVERMAREALGMGSASTRELEVNSGAWFVRGTPIGSAWRERMNLHASVAAERGKNALVLVAVPEKGPAIHGEGGVSRKAACGSCASHYYSFTRLRTTGTLVLDGTRYAVAGNSWMDHEFGSGELQRNQAGWDWFSIQLDDGRDVMLYRLRQKDGSVTPQSSGSIVARDGAVRHLALGAFAIEAGARWKSPHTDAEYPSAWHVRVPSASLDLELRPVVADQELADASGTSYWEGAVEVFDAARPADRLGNGYVELTGYASPISL